MEQLAPYYTQEELDNYSNGIVEQMAHFFDVVRYYRLGGRRRANEQVALDLYGHVVQWEMEAENPRLNGWTEDNIEQRIESATFSQKKQHVKAAKFNINHLCIKENLYLSALESIPLEFRTLRRMVLGVLAKLSANKLSWNKLLTVINQGVREERDQFSVLGKRSDEDREEARADEKKAEKRFRLSKF